MPLCVFFPVFSVVGLVLLFSRLGLSVTDGRSIATLYFVGAATTFIAYVWFAKGLHAKPYQHALLLHFGSVLLSLFLTALLIDESFLSAQLVMEELGALVVILAATKIAYKNQAVLIPDN